MEVLKKVKGDKVIGVDRMTMELFKCFKFGVKDRLNRGKKSQKMEDVPVRGEIYGKNDLFIAFMYL